MKYSKTHCLMLSACLLIFGCSGSGIGVPSENPSQFFGCYEYQHTPRLYINSKMVQSASDEKSTKIRGFYKIRNSDFLLTENQIIFDESGKLQITPRDSGFQYEFRRNVSTPTILIYDELGKEFDLIRSGNTCSL